MSSIFEFIKGRYSENSDVCLLPEDMVYCIYKHYVSELSDLELLNECIHGEIRNRITNGVFGDGTLVGEEGVEMGIKTKKIDIPLWFIERGYSVDLSMFVKSIKHGNLDLFMWLWNNHIDKIYDFDFLFGVAISNEREDIARLIYDYDRTKIKKRDINYMVVMSKFRSIEIIHKLNLGYCNVNAVNVAIINGDNRLAIWLLENRPEFINKDILSRNTMCIAVRENNFEMVKWLHQNRNEYKEIRKGIPNELPMDIASMNGNLEMLKWLNENRKEEGISVKALNLAKTTEVIEWLIKNTKLPITDEIFLDSIQRDDIERVKWLHFNLGPLMGSIPTYQIFIYGRVCSLAVINKKNEIYKWLIDNKK